jgi:sigma-E factor negative regulatory protein RseA
MSEKEWLSALMDGENTSEKSDFHSCLSSEDRTQWTHYHLIGDVLRQETVIVTDSLFADNFAAALEHESSYMTKTKKAPWWSRCRSVLSSFSWGQNLAQLAVAAGVSFLAISGVQWWSLSPENNTLPLSSETPALSVLQTVPFMGTAMPVSMNANSVVPETALTVREQRQRINALLQDYDLQLRLNTLDGSVMPKQKKLSSSGVE